MALDPDKIPRAPDTGRALSAADFANVKPDIKRVDIPALGGHVFVRGMTARERDGYERAILGDDERSYRAYAALRCVCDESGAPIFVDDDATRDMLERLPYLILDGIWNTAATLSAANDESQAAIKKS